MQKRTLFFAVSAIAMAAALAGCNEDKNPDKTFANAKECEAYFGYPCISEVQPSRLSAKNTPLFLSLQACESQFGTDNCRVTQIRSGKTRPADAPEFDDIDLSDPNWQDRVEDKAVVPMAPRLLEEDAMVLYYPIRDRDKGSYYYPGHGYYGGSPHSGFVPIFIWNSGVYTPPYVVGNAGRSALGAAQRPSAGPVSRGVGTMTGPATGGTSAKAGPSGGISSGAAGKAGGFGSSSGGASS